MGISRPQHASAYQKAKERAKTRSAAITLAGQDIAPIPMQKDAARLARADRDFSRYIIKRPDMPLDLGAVSVALAEIAYACLICLYGLGRHIPGVLPKHMGYCEKLPALDRAGIDYLAESNITSRTAAEAWLRESAAPQESRVLHV